VFWSSLSIRIPELMIVMKKSDKGSEQVEIPYRKAVASYTQNMGGVDIWDKKREYESYGVGWP
jgi:hypothetical protein